MRNWEEQLLIGAAQGDIQLLRTAISNINRPIDEIRTDSGVTALMLAAQYEQVECARHLIASGAQLEAKDNDDATALMWASAFGNEKVITCLLGKGAKINEVNNYGVTALMFAVDRDHLACLNTLLSQGANTEELYQNGLTPLMHAAHEGKDTIVSALIEGGASIDAKNQEGNTPLLLAMQNMQTSTIQLLAQAGADLEITDQYGNPLIVVAAFMNYVDAIDILLSANADINARGENSWTATMVVAMDGHVDCLKRLVVGGAKLDLLDEKGKSALIHAATGNHIECVTTLAEARADLRLKQPGKFNALQASSYVGNTEVVRTLLQLGMELEEPEPNEFSALYCAIFGDKREVVQLLHEHGSDIEKKNSYGSTPLMLACSVGSVKATQLLVELNVDIAAVDKDYQMNALMYAAREGHHECAAILLDAHIDIEAGDMHGSTALMWACAWGKTEVVRLLLGRGADINAENDVGQTPLMFALRSGNKECIDLVTASGAKLDAANDRKGFTPIKRAVLAGMTDWAVEQIRLGGRIDPQASINLFGLEVSADGRRLVPSQTMGQVEYLQALNNTLFIAVQQEDPKGVQLALQSGADPLAEIWVGSVSPYGLALHTDNALALGLISAHLADQDVTIDEQMEERARQGIKMYYDVLGATFANSLASKPSDRIVLGRQLSERFQKGKVINVEIRKFLYESTKDRSYMKNGDNFELELQLDPELVEAVNNQGVDFIFPGIDTEQVPASEQTQILQELIIMYTMQQDLSMDMASDPVHEVAITVGLTECLHNTIVGDTLDRGDRNMKDLWHNSISIPKETRLGLDWRALFNVGPDDQPQLSDDAGENMRLAIQAYRNLGGIDMSEIPGIEPMEYFYLEDIDRQNEGIDWFLSHAMCLDNEGAKIRFNGKQVESTDTTTVFTHGNYRTYDGQVVDFKRYDWPAVRHMVDTLHKVPHFRQTFERLKAIYAIAPIAQVMVLTGNTPDFSHLPEMQHVETEKTQPPVISRYPQSDYEGVRNKEELRAIIDEAEQTGQYSSIQFQLGGGVARNGGFETEKMEDRERAAWDRSDPIGDLVAVIRSQRDNPDYGGVDEWPLVFLPKGTDLVGVGFDKVDQQKGVSPYFTTTDNYLETGWLKKKYFDRLQVKEDDTFGYREEVFVYVTQEDLIIPAAICEKNPQHGAGGGQQYYIAKYPEMLRPIDRTLNLLRSGPDDEKGSKR